MNLKEMAAAQALSHVSDGQTLGIGSGSTVDCFTRLLGDKIQHGELRDIRAVPASKATEALAEQMGIPLTSLKDRPSLDLAVDGADEIDMHLNLIKGLGRALLREKVVLTYARRIVIIADESKQVKRLGRGPLPVEILQFEAETHLRWLASLCSRAELYLEANGQPVVTDNGNFIALCRFDCGIFYAGRLAARLNTYPGVLGHGLFLDMADECIIAASGGVRTLHKGA